MRSGREPHPHPSGLASGEPRRIDSAPGEVIFIPRGVVHRFDNFSASAPARILAVVTPGILGAAYFREIAALVKPGVAGGPPHPARARRRTPPSCVPPRPHSRPRPC